MSATRKGTKRARARGKKALGLARLGLPALVDFFPVAVFYYYYYFILVPPPQQPTKKKKGIEANFNSNFSVPEDLDYVE